MVSFLISSKDKNKLIEEYQKIIDKEKIDKFDVSIIETEKAIGIPDVREAQKKIFLKPFRSEKKAIIFDATLGLTIEAQNALLKTLEEPPENTIIILLVLTVEDILPTIKSRCKVISLDREIKLTEDEKETYQKLLNKIQKAKTPEKLKTAQDFGKTKEEAIEFIQNLTLTIRENILIEEEERGVLLIILKELEKAHKTLKTTNANPRLTLENLLFSI